MPRASVEAMQHAQRRRRIYRASVVEDRLVRGATLHQIKRTDALVADAALRVCRALATILKCEQNFQVRACPRVGCSFPAFHLFRGRRAAGSASASDLLRSATADRAAGPAQVRGSCAGSASPNKISCRHPSISHGLSGGNCGRSPAMGAAHGRR